jgi:hypothetical protein
MQKVKFGYPYSQNDLDEGIAYHENKLGFSFQDHESLRQYIAFYRECGPGYDPLPFRFNTDEINSSIDFFARLAPHPEFGYTYDDGIVSCTERLQDTGIEGNVNDAIIIAYGNHLSVGMIIRGKCIGKVFALEDIEPLVLDDDMEDIPSGLEGVTKLGDSFEEFINSLTADEEEIEQWNEDREE